MTEQPVYEMSDYERVHRASIERVRAENQISAEFDRIRAEPGIAFEEPNLRRAANLKRTDLPAFHDFRAFLQTAGVPMWDWDKAVTQTDQADKTNAAAQPHLIQASAFVADYQPPEYRIEGIVQRSRLYSFTGLTGHGKTALSLSMAVHEGLTRELAGRRVNQGNIIYFAAENPDDARARLILMADRMNLNLERLPLWFIAKGFNIQDWLDRIRHDVEAIGGAATVYIDTSPAFQCACGFSDENDNSQAFTFASLLRSLTALPGNPAIVALTHPIKQACKDSLVPRGGGAFLNEMDGNLTCWADGERETTEFHWMGKLRGPSFDPITFALEPGTCARLVDAMGRQIPSVWAYPTTPERAEAADNKHHDEENVLLVAMLEAPDNSLTTWAKMLGWFSRDGSPAKIRVHRALDRLKDQGLVRKYRNRMVLSAKGKTEAEQIKGQAR